MRPWGEHRGGTRRIRTRLVGVLVTAAALVAVPASAQALTVSGTATPTDTTAGAHSDFNIHMAFSGGQVHNLTVGLPPGLVGDPTATPLCTVAELHSSPSACPDNTQVGDVTAVANLLNVSLPITVHGKLFNLTPQPGEPARFGIALSPPAGSQIILESAVQLRSDFGLNSVINGIPNTTVLDGDTTIVSQDLTLYGSRPWMSKPFMRNPTSCDEKTTTISATPYSGDDGSAQASFTPTDCGALDFSPSFSANVGGAVGTQKTRVTTSIDQGPTEAGLLNATVVIPPDLNPDVNLLGNRCSPAAFAASACPPNTVMGSAIATSPLLTQPLAGNVIFVDTGGVPDIGLDLQGQLHLLLRGSLGVDKVVKFNGLPDIPIAHFALTFPTSPGLLTASRNLCVPPAPNFHAEFQGYNGANTILDVPATVEGSCHPLGAKKCKKAKKHKKHRAAEAKKKHKKKSCKKKKRKHKKRR
jgi:hypothetical protein